MTAVRQLLVLALLAVWLAACDDSSRARGPYTNHVVVLYPTHTPVLGKITRALARLGRS